MIAITDYDTGNLRSVANALRRIGAEFTVTSDAAVLRQADRVLLPGVGEASSAMAKLRERGLDALIPTLTQPVLGICIGMQLMCLSSEEGDARCMGIFPTQVLRLPATAADGGDNRYFTRLTEWNLKDNVFSTPFTVPFAWANRQVLFHLGWASGDYELRVNGRPAACNADGNNPAEINITKQAKEGRNMLEVILAQPSSVAPLESWKEAPAPAIGGAWHRVFTTPLINIAVSTGGFQGVCRRPRIAKGSQIAIHDYLAEESSGRGISPCVSGVRMYRAPGASALGRPDSLFPVRRRDRSRQACRHVIRDP